MIIANHQTLDRICATAGSELYRARRLTDGMAVLLKRHRPEREYSFTAKRGGFFACRPNSTARAAHLEHVSWVESRILIAQGGLHLPDVDRAVICEEGGCDARCLSRREGCAHDAQTGTGQLIPVSGAARGE